MVYTYVCTYEGSESTCRAEIKLDIGIGALLRVRIRRTRWYRGLVVRRGRVRIARWSLERTRRGWIRSRGGRTRREGALLRKMTCHSRHVPSSPPSCSATERPALLYLLLDLFSFHFSTSISSSLSFAFLFKSPCHLRINRHSSGCIAEFKDWRIYFRAHCPFLIRCHVTGNYSSAWF